VTVGEVDHYQLLGVKVEATPEEITRAYRAAMKRAHPDKARAGQREAAEERARALNAAYAVLSKPDSRRAYDAELRVNRVQEQIMGRYVAGMGGVDPFAQNLRRAMTEAELRDRADAERSALTSIVWVFGGMAALIVAAVLLYAIASALVGRVV
jgi:curved DNA-binding protein CbpA